MPDALPARAQVVVVGGGVGGCSVAYHLARLGVSDVVVLERHALTEGTTWHSAGFVGQLRSTISQTRLIMYSAGLYDELEALTGRDPGWHGVGGLRLAMTPERVEELQRSAGAATTYGLELELLGPREIHDRLPLLDADGVLAAAWLPGDGYLDPEALGHTLAAGATTQGVAIHEHTDVTALRVTDGRVTSVVTDRGTIEAETVVVCAGAASRAVAGLAGASVPVVPMRHQYVVTEPLGVPADTPTVRDPDRIAYYRPHADGGWLVGGYARDPRPCDAADPLTRPRHLFDADPDRFAEPWAGAQERVPALRDAAWASVVNGVEAFTPDGEFCLGETEVAGLWVAAGFCVHGLAGAGGVGKVLAEWITDGGAGGLEFDVSAMDVRRFGAHHRSRGYARTRALDAYSRYYDVVYPGEERAAGRPLRRPPAYERLHALGAAFGEKSGWERANWVQANAAAGDPALRPHGWAGREWSPAIGAECLATRDAVALFDQSSFAKLDVRGRDAAKALNRVCAADVDREPGRAVYTQLLNDAAGIEADLTVTRLARDHFRVVTGTAFARRDADWIRRGVGDAATVTDVTGAHACLCLWGPRARDLLQPLTDAGLGNDAFPFLRARPISVGPVPVLAQRITFVGELGWELYCPVEYGAALWDLLWAAGADHGLVAAGYRAIDSLRLEKGYRVWGADIDPLTTPDEAGLGFAVALDKPGGFRGRDALARARDAGGTGRRLRCLVLDDPLTVCLGNEPVSHAGAPVGRVTSGGYGHRVTESIAYALLPADLPTGTRVELGVFAEQAGATIAEEPRYDPRSARVRA